MVQEQMDTIIKKVAAINDISCLGGASITQIIPVLSSMGIKTYPVPTVILSTHSGYENYTYKDLTSHMVEQGLHWKQLGVKFDAIYSGFLGSSDQIVIVEDFIDTFKDQDTLVVVDPVMGDKGRVYSSIDEDIIIEMRKLISRSDIITPNLTEAFLLANEEYEANPSLDRMKAIIEKIRILGAKSIVITSFPYESQNISNIIFDNESLDVISSRKINSDFPGTGDIFASVLVGAYINGQSLKEATKTASNFVLEAIEYSANKDYSHRAGVLLETQLHKLYKFNRFNINFR